MCVGKAGLRDVPDGKRMPTLSLRIGVGRAGFGAVHLCIRQKAARKKKKGRDGMAGVVEEEMGKALFYEDRVVIDTQRAF